jgi:[acyl-carrier-protein] S-malonyltransferase
MSGLALLCPGQGDQHPAMLDLALSSAEGARVIAEAGEVLGLDVGVVVREGGPAIFRNAVAQPLLCATELATWAALRDSLPAPMLVLGYSLGELAAHACAGSLTTASVVALARRRAALMDAAAVVPSGLVALRGLPLETVAALCAASGTEIAIVNGPDHVVAGGRLPDLDRLEREARGAGATTVQRLPVGVAAHTSLLAAAVGPFADTLLASSLGAPPVPVLAGVSGAPVRDRAGAVESLSLQLARPVAWARCLAAAREMGATVFLELGPGSALSRMATELLPGAAARSVAEFRSRRGIAAWVATRLAP